MRKSIKNTLLVGLAIVGTIGVVGASDNHYTTFVEVGYPYKVEGEYRNFAEGEQEIVMSDVHIGHAKSQNIAVELVEKKLIGSEKVAKKEILLENYDGFKKSLYFGSRKSGKKKYIFYNNLSSGNKTGVYIGVVEMYPRKY